MEIQIADDIKKELTEILKFLPMTHVIPERIVCIRSHKSTSRATARIWSFPRIWQLALRVEPHYVIEVLSEKFDKLSEDNKRRTLIHELMHIPKNFSGALIPHRGRYSRISPKTVEVLFKKYQESVTSKRSLTE